MVTTGPRPRRSAALRLLVVAVALAGALFGGLLGGAAPASAHAALTGSTPAEGSVVDQAPEQVALTFSEGVAMGDDSIRVLDPKGKRVDRGKLRNLCSAGTVKYGTGLPPGLGDGTYTVAWQAVSADSHPVSGAFTFSIGAPSKTTAPVAQQEAGGGLVGALYGIARALAYAGFVLLAGGAAFVVACRPAAARVRSVQRLVVQGWAVLTGTTVAMLLLRTPYTGSGDLSDVFDLGGLQQVLITKPGAALVSRLLLLAAAALFVAVLFGAYARAQEPREDRPEDPEGPDAAEDPAEEARRRKDLSFGLGIGGVIVATGLAATWAMAEHASTGLQPAIAMPVDVLHLLAVATWLGGLAALVVSLYWGPPVERTAVRRFSRIAFGSVLVLVATGLYQSWRQVGTWTALTGTTYGRLLLLKVGLVAVLVGIAWFSRRWTARLTEVRAPEPDATEAADAADPAEAADPAVADRADEEADAPSEKAVTVPAAGPATEPPAVPTAEPATEPPAAPAPEPDDPARAAQLSRQQAALRTARSKRLRDADPERLGLRRSVLAEASVAVVLLVVTTVLTATEPARTEEAVKAVSGGQSATVNQPQVLTVPFDTGGPGGKGTARIDLDPGRSGNANELRLRISDPKGRAKDVPEVKIEFTLKAKKLGPLTVVPRHTGKGHWRASGVLLPVPGRWQLSLLVRTSDIDQVTEFRNVKIG
ncbi:MULTISPECIES: copper resistance CopC/CopD family protein [Streptomyces]|uniref:Copper resistance protein CopC n=1 Tax=Streptomyces siderophoricus TaxID=2802281 RepID=A0ABS1MUE2_9ACTN|nr:copper resistance protein CopC [Streptomyces sp. 9-7]MBL1091383.1 copper resistance protein CopC [Streptomyces sp. 9-7]